MCQFITKMICEFDTLFLPDTVSGFRQQREDTGRVQSDGAAMETTPSGNLQTDSSSVHE